MNVAQGKGDVEEHDGVADHYGSDVAVALAVDLVLDAALRAVGDGQVGIGVVLNKADEPAERERAQITGRKTCTRLTQAQNQPAVPAGSEYACVKRDKQDGFIKYIMKKQTDH